MKKKILILASNPREDLKLNREIRDLEKAIDRAISQSGFEVEIALAVRPEDLQESFLRHKPHIVHFVDMEPERKGWCLSMTMPESSCSAQKRSQLYFG